MKVSKKEAEKVWEAAAKWPDAKKKSPELVEVLAAPLGETVAFDDPDCRKGAYCKISPRLHVSVRNINKGEGVQVTHQNGKLYVRRVKKPDAR
jgi:hypothetical protein